MRLSVAWRGISGIAADVVALSEGRKNWYKGEGAWMGRLGRRMVAGGGSGL